MNIQTAALVLPANGHALKSAAPDKIAGHPPQRNRERVVVCVHVWNAIRLKKASVVHLCCVCQAASMRAALPWADHPPAAFARVACKAATLPGVPIALAAPAALQVRVPIGHTSCTGVRFKRQIRERQSSRLPTGIVGVDIVGCGRCAVARRVQKVVGDVSRCA